MPVAIMRSINVSNTLALAVRSPPGYRDRINGISLEKGKHGARSRGLAFAIAAGVSSAGTELGTAAGTAADAASGAVDTNATAGVLAQTTGPAGNDTAVSDFAGGAPAAAGVSVKALVGAPLAALDDARVDGSVDDKEDTAAEDDDKTVSAQAAAGAAGLPLALLRALSSSRITWHCCVNWSLSDV